MKRSIFIFLIFVFIFLAGILLTNKIYFQQDLTFLFHPWRTFSAENIQKGQLPLWNAYANGGMPFLANFQTAFFYPLSGFFYHFSFPVALKFFLFLHFFIAGYFFSLIVKNKKVPFLAGIVAGTIFAFNGYFSLRFQFLSLFGSAVWFPLIYIFWQRKKGYLLGLGLALQIFSGYPQISLICAGLLMVFNIIKKKFSFRFMFVFAFLFLLAAGIQLLPAGELFLRSVRGQGLDFSVASFSSTPIKSLVEIVFPFARNGAFGEEVFALSRGIRIGFPGLFLLLLYFFWNKRNKTYVYLLLLTTITLVLGRFTPLFYFFYQEFYFLKFIRYPGQFNYLNVILFSLLAGKGVSLFSERIKKSLIIVLPAAICLELSFVHQNMENITLAAANNNYYWKKEKINFLQNKLDSFRFFNTFKTLNYTYQRDTKQEFNVNNFRDRLYGFIGLPYHLSTAYGYGEPLEIGHYQEFVFKMGHQPTVDSANKLLSLLNIKYLFSRYPINSRSYQLVFSQRDTFVYENKNVLPFVYLVGEARIDKRPLEYLSGEIFDPRKEVILEKNNENLVNLGEGKNDPVFFPVKNVSRIKAESIDLGRQFFTSGWLVITENFYPGWRAFVDGKETKIYRGNHTFMTLPLKEGEHRIKIIFASQPFFWGLMVSVFTFTWITLFAIIRLRKSGRKFMIPSPTRGEGMTCAKIRREICSKSV
ncbi:MAG: YfhO family protein [Elusimicrobiota bacterium]